MQANVHPPSVSLYHGPQVFVVADGGLDLEHCELRSFKELRSILMQVSTHPTSIPSVVG